MTQGRRERKKQETRAALMAAALRLAQERGPDNVTVEEIAEAADVSVRTFFNYFPHKEHAILGRDPEEAERARRRVREAPAEWSPFTVLRDLLSPVLDELVDPASAPYQRMGVVSQSSTLLAQFVLLGHEDEMALAAVLAERMGLPADAMQAQLLVSSMTNAVRFAVRHQRNHPERSLPELVDENLALFAGGLDPAYSATTKGEDRP